MVTSNSSSQTLATPDNLKRWTVEEYYQLSELGLLSSEDRTELMNGQLILMATKSTAHVTSLRLLALKLSEFLRDLPFFS